MAWSQVRETVAEVLSPPDGLILFCGMSIGHEDPAVSTLTVEEGWGLSSGASKESLVCERLTSAVIIAN
jgi:hypothetical protein